MNKLLVVINKTLYSLAKLSIYLKLADQRVTCLPINKMEITRHKVTRQLTLLLSFDLN